MSGACTVVTGATSGIGAAVAARLLAHGENVVAVARRAEELARLYGENPHAVCAVVDLESPDATARVAAAVKERFDAVRGFVHAAGFVAPAPLGLVQDETAHRLFSVHALFPLQFLGWLAKRPNHADGASAVLISSIACRSGACGYAAYAAAKGALEGLLKPAAAELTPRGVRVNAVALGIVDTPMVRSSFTERASEEQIAKVKARYPLGFGTPSDVADVVDFFLGTASRWISGQVLVADGGLSLT
jgi:NAD(P)-dependent dehydrogenase (short-subunit alcohol dehydrogenase family)